jgi:hypothetical protein
VWRASCVLSAEASEKISDVSHAETYEIPLSIFLPIDPAAIRTMFAFDRSPTGVVVLNEVGFRSARAPAAISKEVLHGFAAEIGYTLDRVRRTSHH